MISITPLLLLLLLTTPNYTLSQKPTFYKVFTTIDHPSSPLFPSEIKIKLFNPKPPATHWYSITIESEGKYSGRATLLGDAPPSSQAREYPSDPLLFSWIPPFAADYVVIVHELPDDPSENAITNPLPIQTFSIQNKPNVGGPWGAMIDRIKMLPPCQNVQRMDVYTKWSGVWVGPAMNPPEDTLRGGWVFVPGEDMDCKIETFSNKEFRLLSEEKRIYVLGSSKERGIFLTLVDLMLEGAEKTELEKSVVSKCWGRAMVSKNNMQVMYQDWRSGMFDTTSDAATVVCHNEKVAREGGSLFFNSGKRVWEEIFQDRATWPHVILMSTGDEMRGFNGDLYDINQFVKTLPPEWDGTLFLNDGAFNAHFAGKGYASDYVSYHAKLLELTYITNDPRVRWVDGMGWSTDMIMYGESGPAHSTHSINFHSHCDETYQDADGQTKSMRICSNVTENIAQLLIGHAIGPKAVLKANAEQAQSTRVRQSSDVVICHNCPESIFPFHITPFPDMTCKVGPLHARTDDEATGYPQTCPEQCMEVEVNKKYGSESDTIYERHCPYEFFPRGFQVGNDPIKDYFDDEDIGFWGYIVWMFNFVLLVSLLGYQHRGKIRAYMLKVVNPGESTHMN